MLPYRICFALLCASAPFWASSTHQSVTVPLHFEPTESGDEFTARGQGYSVRINRDGLDLFSNQSSGVLTSAVWGDGVIDNPPGQTVAHGDVVQFIPFAELI